MSFSYAQQGDRNFDYGAQQPQVEWGSYAVDPSMYVPYPPPNVLPPNGLPPNGLPPNGLPPNGLPPNGLPPNGLPPGSKLVTYMTHNANMPAQPLTQAMSRLSIDSSPAANKKFRPEYNQGFSYGPPALQDQTVPTPDSSPPHIPSMQNQILPEFVPGYGYTMQQQQQQQQQQQLQQQQTLPDSQDPSAPAVTANGSQVHQKNVNGTTYYYPTDSVNAPGMQPSPNLGMMSNNMLPSSPYQQRYEQQMYNANQRIGESSMSGLAAPFYPENMPENHQAIMEEISQRNDHIYMPHEMQYPDLPDRVENYTELILMESTCTLSSTYRVTHMGNGKHFIMRRLHAYNSTCNDTVDHWMRLQSPNVVHLHEVFQTKAFTDTSLIFIYDYHPGSETVLSKYLSLPPGSAAESRYDPFSSDPNVPRPYTHQKNALLRAVACGELLPEPVLWNILIQLTAALRTIHSRGLACRHLEASKVLMTGFRVRISCCGTAEAFLPAVGAINGPDIHKAQYDDLIALGRIALALACRSANACLPDNVVLSMKKLSKMYSNDLKNFVMYLVSNTSPNLSVNNLMPIIGARFYTQLESLQQRVDVIEEQLAKEMDNGRLLNILLKFNTIMERPELAMDPKWSETGDRYLLKLFRDYVFHSVTPDGRPWLDQAHIIYCLNQLDAGTNDKVQLISRDELNVLIVKYSELKSFLDKSFDELIQEAERVDPA